LRTGITKEITPADFLVATFPNHCLVTVEEFSLSTDFQSG